MSSSSENRLPTAVGRGGTGTESTPANRDIGSGAGLLSSMMGGGSKNDSTTTGAASDTANTNDQKPQPGLVGQMWQK